MTYSSRISRISRKRLLRHQLRQIGRRFKAGTIYGLMAIALLYTALVMVAITLIGIIATPILSLLSLVLNPLGESLFPKP